MNMNSELARMWDELVVAYFMVLPQYLSLETEEKQSG
jgi:hypothetical protein